jgi:hypothetical protein
MSNAAQIAFLETVFPGESIDQLLASIQKALCNDRQDISEAILYLAAMAEDETYG